MTEPLDDRLREYADRWRDTLPPLTARRARSSVPRWPVAAAAAAVIVISVVLVLTVRTRHESVPPAIPPTPSATGSGWPAGDVPWAPLAATDPTLPATRVPPSPDPADAAGIRTCTAGNLHGAAARINPAMGTDYLDIRFALVGTVPCRLDGRPIVQPLDHGRLLDLDVKATSSNGLPFGETQPVLVTPDTPAAVTIGWAATHSCPIVDNDQLSIRLPGIAAAFTVAGFGTSSCNPGEGTSPMAVGPVGPLHPKPAKRISPYDDVTASGDLNVAARPGQPVRFVVTLTSPKDLALDPCPDYWILTSAGQVAYSLNCAAVPHRDAQGRPYLPAGVPVSFAMQADPGAGSNPKLRWSLVTPSPGKVSIDGTLTIADSHGTTRSATS